MKKLVATTYLLVFPFGAAEEEDKDMLRYLEATFGSLGHILGNLEAIVVVVVDSHVDSHVSG